MLLYLAAPIDQARGNGLLADLRAEAKQYTINRGWAMFDPSMAFTIGPSGPGPLAGVQMVNYAAIDQSDAVVALLPKGVPTIGTPMEVQYALGRGKAVCAVLPDHASWALAATTAEVCPDVETAFAALDILELELQKWEPDAIQIQVLDPDNATLPTRAYSGDAGWDLYASESVTIDSGGFADVPIGLAMAIPHGYFGRITSRSSTFRKRKLDVREGVLDAGYRGPLFAGVHNMSGEVATVERGERVAQMLLHEVPSLQLSIVDVLPESERSSRGFGSSGT